MGAPLEGRVAVVTGASRGIGKGIALELGAAGATVYVTGRTGTGTGATGLPGSLEQTAREIGDLGGTGVAVLCDHGDDAQVKAVFQRVADEHGRLDVLANNVFSSPDLVAAMGPRFWETPISVWDQVIDIGARSHYVAAVYAAPLLFAAGGGLIANISSSGAIQYAHSVPYGVGKAAVDKMTADMAYELADRNVAVVSIWPGLVRTEFVASGAKKTDDGRDYITLANQGMFELTEAESPRFTGRAVVALATAADRMDRTGRAWEVAALAHAYGFTDVDGRVPEVLIRPRQE